MKGILERMLNVPFVEADGDVIWLISCSEPLGCSFTERGCVGL